MTCTFVLMLTLHIFIPICMFTFCMVLWCMFWGALWKFSLCETVKYLILSYFILCYSGPSDQWAQSSRSDHEAAGSIPRMP